MAQAQVAVCLALAAGLLRTAAGFSPFPLPGAGQCAAGVVVHNGTVSPTPTQHYQCQRRLRLSGTPTLDLTQLTPYPALPAPPLRFPTTRRGALPGGTMRRSRWPHRPPAATAAPSMHRVSRGLFTRPAERRRAGSVTCRPTQRSLANPLVVPAILSGACIR